MDAIEFRRRWQAGETWPIVCLVGGDLALQRRYRREVLQGTPVIYDADTVLSWQYRRSLYDPPEEALCVDVPELLFWSVDQLLKLGQRIVLAYSEIKQGPVLDDPRVVEVRCKLPTIEQMVAEVTRQLGQRAIGTILVELCGRDWGAIEEALDALIRLQEPITPAILEELFGDGIPDPDEDDLWAWLENKPGPVIDYLDRWGSDGLFRKLSQLYSVMRQIIPVQCYSSLGATAVVDKTGLSWTQVNRWRTEPVHFGSYELLTRLLWVQQLEGAVRSGTLLKEHAWRWLIAHWFTTG